MKTIIITTKFGPVVMHDNDARPKEQIAEDLAELLRATNITILKTSYTSAVIRPSLVSGIVVQDDAETPTKESTPIFETSKQNEPQDLEQNIEDVPNEEIDIIKDMD